MGIVVDPDVDRLALITEDGTPFREEYTLVAVADYVLNFAKRKKVTPFQICHQHERFATLQKTQVVNILLPQSVK